MNSEDFTITDVWAANLEEEFEKISFLLELYPYIGMDTEFPGFLKRSFTAQLTPEEQRYYAEAVSINLTKIIQIGITLSDEGGITPHPCCTWQFNFKFSKKEDIYSPKAISLLEEAGIDFDEFEKNGIDVVDFAHLFYSSGLVNNPNIVWITFHGSYDFGYLLKMVTHKSLPSSEKDFFKLLRTHFPRFYDIKAILNYLAPSRSGGLQSIADDLGVERHGRQHQAGSDSQVTLETYFRLIESTEMDYSPLINILYGLQG